MANDPYANLSNTFQEMTRNLIAMKGQQMQQALSEAELGMRGNQFNIQNYGTKTPEPGAQTFHARQIANAEDATRLHRAQLPIGQTDFSPVKYSQIMANLKNKTGLSSSIDTLGKTKLWQYATDPNARLDTVYDNIASMDKGEINEFLTNMANEYEGKIQKDPNFANSRQGKMAEQMMDFLYNAQTGADIAAGFMPEVHRGRQIQEANSKAAILQATSAERQALAAPDTQYIINKTQQYIKAGMPQDAAAVKAYEDLSELKAKTAKAGKIDIRMSPAGGGGFSGLGANDKNFWFEQYELTGKLPPFAYRDVESRNQFTKGYAQYQREKGNTAADAYGVRAQKDAQKSAFRDLEKRDVLQNTFINKIEENSNTVMRIAEKYGNNWNRVINLPVNKASQILGSGDYAALRLALKSTSNEIAKVESGSLGIAEVSATQAEYMAKIHDPNLTVGEMLKVIEMGRELGRNAKKAVGQQKKDLLSEMSGRPRAIPDQPAPPNPGRRSTDPKKIGRFTVEVE